MAVATNHQVPLLDVARRHDGRSFAFQDTLLASADSLGRVVLWRRTHFFFFFFFFFFAGCRRSLLLQHNHAAQDGFLTLA